MKNKKMMVIGVVALIAVTVWYFWLRKPKVATGTPAEDQPTPVTNTAFSAGGKRLIVPGYN